MRRIFTDLSILAIMIFGLVALPLPVFAQSAQKDLCNGATGNNGCTTSGPTLTDVVKEVVDILSIIVGVAAVIMIIIAGFRYVTSGGDSSKISGAKDALIYALVGLVIVALSQAIVKFVLNKTGI